MADINIKGEQNNNNKKLIKISPILFNRISKLLFNKGNLTSNKSFESIK